MKIQIYDARCVLTSMATAIDNSKRHNFVFMICSLNTQCRLENFRMTDTDSFECRSFYMVINVELVILWSHVLYHKYHITGEHICIQIYTIIRLITAYNFIHARNIHRTINKIHNSS